MSFERRRAKRPVPAAAALLAALLVLGSPGLRAQEPPPEPPTPPAPAGFETTVTVEGVRTFRPRAVMRTNRPGYVALFEIHPGVGAVMLYPHDPDGQEVHPAGTHEIPLNGLRTALRRRLVHWHLGHRLEHARLAPSAHLLAVVSEDPVHVGTLRSDRVFEASHAARSPGDVRDELLASAVSGRAGTRWAADGTRFRKFPPDPFLAFDGTLFSLALYSPYLVTRRDLAFFGAPLAGRGSTVLCLRTLADRLYHVYAFGVRSRFGCPVGPRRYRRYALLLDRHRLDTLRNGDDPTRGDDTGRRGTGARDDGSARTEGRPVRPGPLPDHVRDALDRIADATEDLRPTGEGEASPWRRLESVGATLRARGLRIDAEGLRAARRRIERARTFGSRRGARRPHGTQQARGRTRTPRARPLGGSSLRRTFGRHGLDAGHARGTRSRFGRSDAGSSRNGVSGARGHRDGSSRRPPPRPSAGGSRDAPGGG